MFAVHNDSIHSGELAHARNTFGSVLFCGKTELTLNRTGKSHIENRPLSQVFCKFTNELEKSLQADCVRSLAAHSDRQQGRTRQGEARPSEEVRNGPAAALTLCLTEGGVGEEGM